MQLILCPVAALYCSKQSSVIKVVPKLDVLATRGQLKALARSGLLSLGNSRKLIETLRPMLDPPAIQRLESEHAGQSQLLFNLSLYHFKFADNLTNAYWRQRVSRLYYSSYSASKCVRFYVFGDHSKEVSDHKKVGELPNDFPQRALYANQLSVLRDDRNSCDYDHECSVGDLVISQSEARMLVRQFLLDVRSYIAGKGLNLRGQP